MMATPSIFASAPTQGTTASDASNAALNYDAFLRLLVAQMKNQDPTEPTDPAQSLAQLASFSAVEQSIKINAKLDNLMAVAAIGQADALIGKTITSADGKVTGVVKSIAVFADGYIAILRGGEKVILGPGIKISDK